MQERKLLILYGSQTGTAQEVAERIWREAKCYHFGATVRAMDEYKISELLYEKLIVFVCSTTGQGDQPDNMKKFWKFLLRKNLPSNSLQNVKFCVLGLGDSSYVKFNHVAKKLYRRLLNLGGNSICDVGLADDQHDLGADAVVDPWITSLWKTLLTVCPLPEGVIPLDLSSLLPSRWNVDIVSTENSSSVLNQYEQSKCSLQWESNPSLNSCTATVLSNEKTTADEHFQDVRLLKFSANSVTYKPGDVALIRPHNRSSAVKQLMDILSESKCQPNLNSNTILQVLERDSDMPVPLPLRNPITLERCAAEYWDLNAVPRRYAFQLMSQLTPNDTEKEKLEEFCSAAGQDDLFNYSNRPRRTIIEALSDFPHASANIPLNYLFEIFQPIRPRLFSIASSFKAHKNELHLLVAVVKYKTKLFAPRLGLCSNYLASLQPGDVLPVRVRSGSFIFPDKEPFVIMVGPGTGVAPFRSYIWEKVIDTKANNVNLHLFFGCRNREADFHCRDEWEKLQSEKCISLYTAFSRDQPHKIYVQHIIEENSVHLWDILKSKEAFIFVAGNANNMPESVKEAFVKVCCKEGAISTDDAKHILEEMELRGHYQTETWA